jgi:hypothetical protein
MGNPDSEGLNGAYMQQKGSVLLLFLFFAGQLMNSQTPSRHESTPESFGAVVHAVDAVSPTIILSNNLKQSLVAVSAKMQGRVLTSTADGWSGRSLGWVNGKFIAAQKVAEHFNAYGGEDRVWIGPEGGQFSVFFTPGAPFDLDHWFTPKPVDTEPFEVIHQSQSSVAFRRRFTLVNYSGTEFQVQIDREIRILSNQETWKNLKLSPLPGLKVVAFESINKLTNAGSEPWTKKTGLLSLWILGQFPASPEATIVVPIREGSMTELGKRVNADYFGHIPSDRLAVNPNVVYLKADAEYRGKLGINPKRAKGILGSYDAQNHVLTLVQYTLPGGNAEYVNSAWKIQDDPFNGDVANSYNDGPQPSSGARLGHFYEMESSSPAAALSPDQSIEHVQRTIHIEGEEQQLDKVARSVLGVGIDDIQNAFPK